MTTLSEIVDAADGLSVDEQISLLEILRRRVVERNRQQLLDEVKQSRDEFASGRAQAASAGDIINEASGEA